MLGLSSEVYSFPTIISRYARNDRCTSPRETPRLYLARATTTFAAANRRNALSVAANNSQQQLLTTSKLAAGFSISRERSSSTIARRGCCTEINSLLRGPALALVDRPAMQSTCFHHQTRLRKLAPSPSDPPFPLCQCKLLACGDKSSAIGGWPAGNSQRGLDRARRSIIRNDCNYPVVRPINS